MNIPFHLLTVMPLCYFLYPYIGLVNTIFLFLGGWAFDIDHYFYCIVKHKSFSLKKCYEFHHPWSKEKDLLHIFHTIEFYLLVLIIGLFVEPVLYLFFGLIYHISFDFMQIGYLRYYKKDYEKTSNCRAHSLIMWLRRH
ncbi:hypothetical protein J4404_01715 [Candidatus Woesearchaeota archaeon]|nr:hypothetical protein [Candidatus Woesearchaeota archaeon]